MTSIQASKGIKRFNASRKRRSCTHNMKEVLIKPVWKGESGILPSLFHFNQSNSRFYFFGIDSDIYEYRLMDHNITQFKKERPVAERNRFLM